MASSERSTTTIDSAEEASNSHNVEKNVSFNKENNNIDLSDCSNDEFVVDDVIIETASEEIVIDATNTEYSSPLVNDVNGEESINSDIRNVNVEGAASTAEGANVIVDEMHTENEQSHVVMFDTDDIPPPAIEEIVYDNVIQHDDVKHSSIENALNEACENVVQNGRSQCLHKN